MGQRSLRQVSGITRFIPEWFQEPCLKFERIGCIHKEREQRRFQKCILCHIFQNRILNGLVKERVTIHRQPLCDILRFTAGKERGSSHFKPLGIHLDIGKFIRPFGLRDRHKQPLHHLNTGHTGYPFHAVIGGFDL